VALLVCVPVLALMQWQWHQLVQSVWMMSRSQNCLDQTLPLTQTQAAQDRLSLGIPLLLLPPFPSNAEPTTSQQSVPEHQDRQQEQEPPTPEAAPEEPSTAAAEQPKQEEELLEELPEEVRPEEESSMPTSPTSIDSGIAVAPEQESEENQGTNLNT
jgi:outer membrane biosynthesis protein TonB